MSERSRRTGGPGADGTDAEQPTGSGGAEQPTPAVPGGADDELGATVAALTADDIAPARRRQLLTRLVGQARARGLTDLFKPRSAIRWMADTVAEVAPHVPIRDLATLRRHFPGLDDDELAERLIRNAARATAGVGAAGGGVAAVEWAVTPTLLSAPVLLAAETVSVVAIELKLIGELHEIHRVPLPTGGTQRAVALVQSWASKRGINPMMPGVGVSAVLSTAARRELRDSLLRRFGRNLTTLGPFLTGAAVAGYLNRRATRTLADELRTDLRRRGRELPGGRPALP
ncbi:hypothetical protein Q2K19_02650 [Micromonospora soli]|uniref:hypothetical protein n=1 Tax=Micromonospora sp. NBRC 110009 TaxID=3061627 RepID=UPI0026733756|nr:hypothetical protein [Micromonospora sp. NBRC 110009]WKT99427.1 hypothetical protein Q2K19_02650 [Micromonospora sp. NBRC 110009]